MAYDLMMISDSGLLFWATLYYWNYVLWSVSILPTITIVHVSLDKCAFADNTYLSLSLLVTQNTQI